MEKLDAKFYGTIMKAKDSTVLTDDEYMVFLVKDRAFLPTLKFYRAECERIGSDRENLDSIDRAISRAEQWQAAFPHRMKVPDARGERLLG